MYTCRHADNGSATCSAAQRQYLTCAVRLSPEKDPHHFVAFAAALHASGALQRLALTPLLLSSTDTSYAHALRADFERLVPCGEVDRKFHGPEDLAHIFAATRLNVHPCKYDAYGMTIVEAASQGAPSLVQMVRHSMVELHEICALLAGSVLARVLSIGRITLVYRQIHKRLVNVPHHNNATVLLSFSLFTAYCRERAGC